MLEHPYIDPDDTLSKETRQMMANNFEPISATDRQAQGLIEQCDDLFNAETNLRAALAIWLNSGWGPWATTKP